MCCTINTCSEFVLVHLKPYNPCQTYYNYKQNQTKTTKPRLKTKKSA